MTDRVGQQLGNYRLVRLLGEGGFAQVYLGEHVYLGTQAALKILHTQLSQDDFEQFHAEARIVASLEHPFIIRVLDFGIVEKMPYLVMSYAPNGTFRQSYPKGTRLPLTTISTYTTQVAQALQYAHTKKIIHRDIKPENILLGRSHEALLSDFGIALISQTSRSAVSANVIGTVAYMAPEQIQGKAGPASDQYALAVVVYEWMTGERPFHGSFTEIAVQHTVAPPPPLRTKLPDLSVEVEQVVLTALQKDPQQRFAHVQSFAIALQQAVGRMNQQMGPGFLIVPTPFSSFPQSHATGDSKVLATPHEQENVLPQHLTSVPVNTPMTPTTFTPTPLLTPPLSLEDKKPFGSGLRLWLMLVAVLLVIAIALGATFVGLHLLRGTPVATISTKTPAPNSTSDTPVVSSSTSIAPTSALPTPTPTPMPTPTPSPTVQAQAVIQRYYDDINATNYQDAYNQWGSNYQSTHSYSSFASGFAQTIHDSITFGAITSLSDGTVQVEVTLQAVSSGPTTSTFHGYYIVGQENGSWKLLNANFSQTS